MATLAYSHTYVTSPITRCNQVVTNIGCRGPSCLGPCECERGIFNPNVLNKKRGDVIKVDWPRNNHAGGFIRMAWAPFDDSDKHEAFDNNVQLFSCHEAGACVAGIDKNNLDGPDPFPNNGKFGACDVSVKIPPHISDGKWTLQWAWFGGAAGIGDYYSCIDINVSGGANGNAPKIEFQGGDASNPNNKNVCKFFNTDELHKCTIEPCNNPKFEPEKKIQWSTSC